MSRIRRFLPLHGVHPRALRTTTVLRRLCVPTLAFALALALFTDARAQTETPTPVATPTATSTVEPLDHFGCYEIHRKPLNLENVSLVDEFGLSVVTVRKAKRLCAPADKNGEDPTAPGDPAHLMSYTIKQTSPHFARARVIVDNQFGPLTFDVVKPSRLLVPTAKSLTGPPGPLANLIDHFKCYKVKGSRFRLEDVPIVTQFGALTIDIKRPLDICLPVDKNGEGVLDPNASLMCYQIRGPRPQFTGNANTINQFEPATFPIFGVRELCVPSTAQISLSSLEIVEAATDDAMCLGTTARVATCLESAPATGNFNLTILDGIGGTVQTVVDEVRDGGLCFVDTWDGKDSVNSPVPPGVYTVRARWTVDGDVIEKTATVTVVGLVLHPISDDFTVGVGARLLISSPGPPASKYHTIVKTTKADTVAQTSDRKVKITAHLTPQNLGQGLKVYFRVLNPDPNDGSTYVGNFNTGDNRETTDKAGKLSAGSDTAVAATINAVAVAAAETELTFTNRYSGDNYKVHASFDANFSRLCDMTPTLVAWKRIWLEQDNMYAKGATLTMAFTQDGNATDDTLNVDATADFAVADDITIFSPGGTSVDTVVNAKTGLTLTIPDLNTDFVQYSGVKLKNDNTTLSVGTNLLTNAYGLNTSGSDGGTFVEFIGGATGSGNMPHYTSFPNDTVSFALCGAWFQNAGNNTNIVQLVAADKHSDNSLGTTRSDLNISFVTTENHPVAMRADAVADTAVHELAHQFNVANGHVDMNVNAANHAGTDQCVMSYNTNITDNISEFDANDPPAAAGTDTSCMYEIRDASDPR